MSEEDHGQQGDPPPPPPSGGGDGPPRFEPRPGGSDLDRRPRRRGRRGRGGAPGPGGFRPPGQPFRPGAPPPFRPAPPPRDAAEDEQTRDLANYERRQAQQQRRTAFRPSSWGPRQPTVGGFNRGPGMGAPRPPMGGGFSRPPMGGAARGGPRRLAGYQEQVRRVTAGPRTHAPSHDAGEPIVGPHAVIEAIRSGRAVRKLYVSQDRSLRTGPVNDLIAEAQQRRIFVNFIDKMEISRLSPIVEHQGVVAIVEGRPGVDLDELLLHLDNIADPALVLVVDSLQDPQNFGVLLRSAEGTGVDGVVIPRHRAVGMTAAVAKTSAGASEHLLVADVANLRQAIDALKEKGVWVVGADETGDLLYDEVDYRGPTAIVIGGEGEGIRRLVLEGCDQVVRIPMAGQVKSLNAAAAGTVILYEALRQRTRDVAPPDTQTPRPVSAEVVDDAPDGADERTDEQIGPEETDASEEPEQSEAADVQVPERATETPRKRAPRKSTARAKKKEE